MNDRILQFLKEKNFSSTKLADLINVQRSSISHILSGRNKPSFDFIQKFLNKFPEIDAQWLITGKGTMFTNSSVTEQLSYPDKNERNLFTALESDIQKPIINTPEIEKPQVQNIITPKIKELKKIERVMIFYTDGTFKDYHSTE